VKQIFYSAPSRLMGQRLRVYIFDARIEAYLVSHYLVSHYLVSHYLVSRPRTRAEKR
jgi:hypothetical protein